jgi:hypothetical protein
LRSCTQVRYANIAIIEGIGASQDGMVLARIAEIVLCDEAIGITARSSYRASGEDKASSSLETTDGVPHAAAE